jgi:hypothetical protein
MSKDGIRYNGIVFLVIGLLFLAVFVIWIPYAVYSIIRWIIDTLLSLIDALKWRVIS